MKGGLIHEGIIEWVMNEEGIMEFQTDARRED